MSEAVNFQEHTIYIGNATRQVQDFCYKVDLKQGNRHQIIQPGSQVKLSGKFDHNTTAFIIAQHEKYGMVEDGAIDRTRTFAGLCYSVDKPIKAGRLTMLFQANVDQLVERGNEIREAAAVAQNMNVQQALIEADRNERVNTFEITVQQEDHDPNDINPQVSVGMRIDNRNTPQQQQLGAKIGKRRSKSL